MQNKSIVQDYICPIIDMSELNPNLMIDRKSYTNALRKYYNMTNQERVWVRIYHESTYLESRRTGKGEKLGEIEVETSNIEGDFTHVHIYANEHRSSNPEIYKLWDTEIYPNGNYKIIPFCIYKYNGERKAEIHSVLSIDVVVTEPKEEE